MNVRLAYGESGLTVDLASSNLTIIEPICRSALPDERQTIVDALRRPIGTPPLRDLVRSSDRVVVVFSDITRPVPNRAILPPLLAEIEHVPNDQITLLNGVGLHRPNTQAELEAMLGPEVVRRYRVINHDAHDRQGLVFLGHSRFGGEIWLNRVYVEADVRIVTGFIEPHFFAGFSGGPKGVLPGVAGAETIVHNHGAPMIGHPNARWGIARGNPIHEEQRDGVALAEPHFLLNVATNRDKQITGVFAGHYLQAYELGCEFVRASAMRAVDRRFPIVVTTNSGYPLDLNLYQVVKGIAAAEEIVEPGGAIVVAAECREGTGHGDFARILEMREDPHALLDLITRPDFRALDQWQVQILARILTRARVFLYSRYLSPAEIRHAHLEPVESVEAAVERLLAEYGRDAPICVLPQGPLTIPYVVGERQTTVAAHTGGTRSGDEAGRA